MWCGAVFPHEIGGHIGAFLPRRWVRRISRTHRAGKEWARRELRSRSVAFICTHEMLGAKGSVHAFHPPTGAETWSQPLRAGSTCSPAVDEAWVYTCDHVGNVESRNLETGLLRWWTCLNMEVDHTHLLLYRGKLLVRTLHGVLVCLCSRTGREKWRMSLPNSCDDPLLQMYDTAPARSSSGKMVYYIDSRARLIGVSLASGEPCWADGPTSRNPLTHTTRRAKGVPIVGKGYIWLMYSVEVHHTDQGPHEYVVCLASNTGRLVWSRYAGFERCCLKLASPTQLLVTDLEGGLSALDPKTGSTLWCFQTDFSISVGTPAMSQDLIFIVDTCTTLFAVDARDGTCRWRAALPHAISSPPVYARGLVLVASETDGIFAHDARDGALVWHRDVGQLVHFCGLVAV